jgi:hypothetical protein
MRRRAVSRLAESGRRRIALINHDLSYRYARLRERGYKSVLHVRELAYQQVTYASDLSAAAGKAAMETLLASESGRMRYLPSPTRWRRAPCGRLPRPDCGCRTILRSWALMARSWRRWSRRS